MKGAAPVRAAADGWKATIGAMVALMKKTRRCDASKTRPGRHLVAAGPSTRAASDEHRNCCSSPNERRSVPMSTVTLYPSC
jgi:hypothetical protein